MNKFKQQKIIMAMLVLGAMFVGGAQASVSLQNGSFENTLFSDGSQVYDAYPSGMWNLPNWTGWNGDGSNLKYVYNRTSAAWTTAYGTTAAPDGEQVLGLGRYGTSSVYQDLGTVATGESYTFSGLIGKPADLIGASPDLPTDGFLMQLYVGTSWATATPILNLNNGNVTDPARGAWQSWSGTSSVITSGQNGQHLYAYLYAADSRAGGSGSGEMMREFDNLQLTVNTPTLQTNGVACSIAPTVSISWFASNGIPYQVQWTTPPTNGSSVWNNLNSPIYGNGATNTVLDANSSLSLRAYRVLSTQ
jgi:hypothetical protein